MWEVNHLSLAVLHTLNGILTQWLTNIIREGDNGTWLKDKQQE
jgi:hypothetical protein